jgi:hypothetical protein
MSISESGDSNFSRKWKSFHPVAQAHSVLVSQTTLPIVVPRSTTEPGTPVTLNLTTRMKQ